MYCSQFLIFCRPTLFGLSIIRLFTPYLKHLGTPAFRRRFLDFLPIPSLHKVAKIVDTMENQASVVFSMKKEALKAGDEAVVQQVGEGKDIMSILC